MVVVFDPEPGLISRGVLHVGRSTKPGQITSPRNKRTKRDDDPVEIDEVPKGGYSGDIAADGEYVWGMARLRERSMKGTATVSLEVDDLRDEMDAGRDTGRDTGEEGQ